MVSKYTLPTNITRIAKECNYGLILPDCPICDQDNYEVIIKMSVNQMSVKCSNDEFWIHGIGTPITAEYTIWSHKDLVAQEKAITKLFKMMAISYITFREATNKISEWKLDQDIDENIVFDDSVQDGSLYN